MAASGVPSTLFEKIHNFLPITFTFISMEVDKEVDKHHEGYSQHNVFNRHSLSSSISGASGVSHFNVKNTRRIPSRLRSFSHTSQGFASPGLPDGRVRATITSAPFRSSSGHLMMACISACSCCILVVLLME